jgi:hypothetical protein
MKVALYTTSEVTNNLSHCYLAFFYYALPEIVFLSKRLLAAKEQFTSLVSQIR